MGHMEKGDILYGEIDRYCRGVYVKNGRSTFPVIWGRSFQKSDFFAGKKVALIGRNRRNDCQTIDGKAYYAVQGELYEVIGILGIESPSLLDNYLWINLDAMLDFFQSDGFYVLDGGRKSGNLLQDTSLGDIIREADIEKMGVRAMYKGRSTGLFSHICFSVIVPFNLCCNQHFFLAGESKISAVRQEAVRSIGFQYTAGYPERIHAHMQPGISDWKRSCHIVIEEPIQPPGCALCLICFNYADSAFHSARHPVS